VYALREMAFQGKKPSEMLRMIISRHPEDRLTRDVFARYFREAFCFLEGGDGPLWGWLPDGTGELKDADIDDLMTRRIEKHKPVWENTPRSSS
jgi:hypothetical protein